MRPVAIITGGTGYLGSAIATELESRGWFVAKLSRSAKDFPCDVTDTDSVQRAVQKVVDTYGRLSAVIHASAPALERVPATETSGESAGQHMAVAVGGIQNLFNAVAGCLKKDGTFIGITTDATKAPNALALGNYVEAKREMEAFLQEQKAPFKMLAFSVGFLPGGLNADLPEQVRTFFAGKSESVESVARRIADLCASS